MLLFHKSKINTLKKYTKDILFRDNLELQELDKLYHIPIVRFGNSKYLDIDKRNIVYNSIENSKFSFDKNTLFNTLQQNGYLVLNNANENSKNNKLFVGFKGKLKEFFNNYSDFLQHFKENRRKKWNYFSIPEGQRFRIYCAHGKILCFFLKNSDNNNVKNFTLIKQDLYNDKDLRELLTFSLNLVRVLHLDFAEVDLIFKRTNNDSKDIYIEDVNVCFDLKPKELLVKFSSYLKWLIHPSYREHFRFDRYNNGESLKWKSNQFINNNFYKIDLDNLNQRADRKIKSDGRFFTVNIDTIPDDIKRQVTNFYQEAIPTGEYIPPPLSEEKQTIQILRSDGNIETYFLQTNGRYRRLGNNRAGLHYNTLVSIHNSNLRIWREASPNFKPEINFY